jgi:sugar/nucleoside kinase (ribokinase family)
VHTLPATRLLGTLAYLAEHSSGETFEIALGHDLIVGNEREFTALAGTAALPDAIRRFQEAMAGSNLRAAIVSRGALGAIAFDRRETWESQAIPVDALDTTGAGDAFAAAIAFGAALRWDWPDLLRFANTVAGLSTTALGAQTALPTFAEVQSRLTADSRRCNL